MAYYPANDLGMKLCQAWGLKPADVRNITIQITPTDTHVTVDLAVPVDGALLEGVKGYTLRPS